MIADTSVLDAAIIGLVAGACFALTTWLLNRILR
jgi:hypothetical protein